MMPERTGAESAGDDDADPAARAKSDASHTASSVASLSGSDSAVQVRSATSFVAEHFSDRRLLRASYMSAVLHARCRVLGTSLGSARTYAMSCPVNGVDLFLSHNWSVSRMDKFYVLSLFFNLSLLMYYSACIILVAMALELCGLSPKISLVLPTLPPAPARDIPVVCQCLSLGSIILVLFGHEVRRLCRLDFLSVFLDKTCIDQRTDTAKVLGIQSLGMFVVNSRGFFVIYSETYFTRLWTVYEIATFLLLKPGNEILFVPTMQAKLILVAIALLGLVRIPFLLAYSEAVTDFLEQNDLVLLNQACWLSLTSGFLYLWMVYDREWAYQQSCMVEQIKRFSLDTAECAHEPDRQTVKNNILTYVHCVEDIVLRGSSDEEKLAAFEMYVRQTLPQKLRRHGVMTRGAPYRCVLALFHSVALHGVDEFWSAQPGGAFHCIALFTWAFCLYPVIFQLNHWLVSRRLAFRHARWKERLYTSAHVLAIVISRNVLVAVFRAFAQRCYEHAARGGADRVRGVCMFAGAILLSVALVVWCYRVPRCSGRAPPT